MLRYFVDVYHSHFGKVEESVLREVGRPLLDKGQVGEVHALRDDDYSMLR